MTKEIDLYFLSAEKPEREFAKQWIASFTPQTVSQVDFVRVVKRATMNIDFDFKIAMYDPSVDSEGKIFYEQDSNFTPFSVDRWVAKVKAFYRSGYWYSDVATIEELFLYYTLLIASDMFTVSELCDEPNIGHMSSLVQSDSYGIWNTKKLVRLKNEENVFPKNYAVVGGLYVPPTNVTLDDRIEGFYTKPLVSTVPVVVVKQRDFERGPRERERDL